MKRTFTLFLVAFVCCLLSGCKPKPSVKEPTVEEWSKSPAVVKNLVQVRVQTVTANTMDGGLLIDLNVKNLSDTRKIEFSTWNGDSLGDRRHWATLIDNFGNEYKRKNPSSWTDSIYPASEKLDRLEFEPPVNNIQWLHLELPAENFGGNGMIRFEIAETNIIQ
jgi:hypothetical protein